MRLLKITIVLILLTMTFAQLTYADNSAGGQNECSYSNIFSGIKAQDLIEIIAKYCDRWTGEPWVLEKLDINTGVYNTVGVLQNASKYYPEAVSFPGNIAVLDDNGSETSFDVVSLSTMKVAGKITVDAQSWGEDLCQIEGHSLLISPDGTRLAVAYIPNEQKDCTQAIGIFDLKTYKLVNTLYNIRLGEFSSDSKFLYAYAHSTPLRALPIGSNLYLIDADTGKIVSQLDVTTLNAYPNLDKDYWIGRYAEDGKLVKIFQLKDVNANGSPAFLYNMNTKAATPTITTFWYSCAGEGSWSQCLPHLSPGAKWWVTDNAQHNQITIYNVSTGSKVAGFTISSSTGKGAIISWPDAHTFIYNTTQKLIYFDIKQNKIIKQISIIRPWEKPGWKPEVGK